jgi:hypothetical protein
VCVANTCAVSRSSLSRTQVGAPFSSSPKPRPLTEAETEFVVAEVTHVCQNGYIVLQVWRVCVCGHVCIACDRVRHRSPHSST